MKKFNLTEAHEYWKHPPSENRPELYMEGLYKSESLFRLMKDHIKKYDSILELGCNVGRNLAYLYHNGFEELWGIDINEDAIKKNICPEAKFMIGSIEEVIKKIPDKNFDIVFSMAVLMHIPPESDWIMEEIARITNKYIFIMEMNKSYRLKPDIAMRCYYHDYSVFCDFGFKELYSSKDAILSGSIIKVFKRNV